MNRKKRREHILQSAVTVFARQGYLDSTVFDVIREAGIARGTFYLYYKNKKDVLNGVVDQFFLDLTRSFDQVTINHDDLPFAEALRVTGSELIGTLTRNQLLIKIFLSGMHTLDASTASRITMFFEDLSKKIETRIRDRIRQNIFRDLKTAVVASTILGSAKQIMSSWMNEPTLELEPVIEGMIDYLLSGLLPVQVVERTEELEVEKPHRQNLSHVH